MSRQIATESQIQRVQSSDATAATVPPLQDLEPTPFDEFVTPTREEQLAELDARGDALNGHTLVRHIVRIPQDSEFHGPDYIFMDSLSHLGERLIAKLLEFRHSTAAQP